MAHGFRELAGKGRQRFQEAALPFAEQRVKGQRGFPGAGHTRDDCEAMARNPHIEALEVVLLGASDDDGRVFSFSQWAHPFYPWILGVPARNSWIILPGHGHHSAGVWGHGSAPSGVTARGAVPRWKCTSPSPTLIQVFQARCTSAGSQQGRCLRNGPVRRDQATGVLDPI